MKDSLGSDLVKIALANLANRNEFAQYKDKLNTIDSSKVTI
jgi:hypothetical protein